MLPDSDGGFASAAAVAAVFESHALGAEHTGAYAQRQMTIAIDGLQRPA